MAVCGKNGFFAKLFDEAAYSVAYAAIIQTGGWRGTLWIPLCKIGVANHLVLGAGGEEEVS